MSFLQTLGAIARGISEGKSEREKRRIDAENRAFQQEQRDRARKQWQEQDLMAPILKQREEEAYKYRQAEQARQTADNQFVQEPVLDTSGLPFGGLMKDAQLAMGASRPSTLTVKQQREMDYLLDKLKAKNEMNLASKLPGMNIGLAKAGMSPFDIPGLGGGDVSLLSRLSEYTSNLSPKPQRVSGGRTGTTAGTSGKASINKPSAPATKIFNDELRLLEEKRKQGSLSEEEYRKQRDTLIQRHYNPGIAQQEQAQISKYGAQARVLANRNLNSPAYRGAE